MTIQHQFLIKFLGIRLCSGNCQRSCRQLILRESYPYDSLQQLGQQDPVPSFCATSTATLAFDTFRSTLDTCQGFVMPRIWA
ncbi:hypothetical protein MNBD_GAMMA12-80 [hydrothermal vent metagenome]|uniref:Uncharacterized protein n=1 Tax=hydrothermal vent metagenome TaxID=652676 RepID=A0A3B0Y451_9ZZZZ